MLKDGSYVRLLLSPNTRLGTLHLDTNGRDEQQFVFRQDPRFGEKLEMFINEGEVEESERPSNEEIAVLRALINVDSSC